MVILAGILGLCGCGGTDKPKAQAIAVASDPILMPPPTSWMEHRLDLPGLGMATLKLPARMLADSAIVVQRDLSVHAGKARSKPGRYVAPVGSWKRASRTVFLRAEAVVRPPLDSWRETSVHRFFIELWEKDSPMCTVVVVRKEEVGLAFDRDIHDLTCSLLWSELVF
jgi:hypothetical protein